MRELTQRRFWEKVKKTNGCWVWRGSHFQRSGYGEVRVAGKRMPAHRLSYLLTHGEIPSGKYILHSCDNPTCVNPAHLRAGTPRENMIDKACRFRCNQSELKREDVLEIRRLCKLGVLQKEIAKQYGVHKSTISHINNKRTYSYV